MRRAAPIPLAIMLATCSGGSEQSFPDARVFRDARPTTLPPPMCTPPSPLCSSTCGNNVIDLCWLQFNDCMSTPMTEACDGVMVPTCIEAGFFGGTSACSSYCKLDTNGCDPCSSNVLACASFAPLFDQAAFVASGTHVALGSQHAVAIFDATLTEVARPQVSSLTGMVATPNGWLLARSGPATLQAVDRTGVLATEHAIHEGAVDPSMAYRAGQVLLAWREVVEVNGSSVWHLFFAMTDATGSTVTVPVDLFAITSSSLPAATTDGTSFFIGTNGTLVRIAADGARTTVTGFPTQANFDKTLILWGGSTGWYILNNQVAQRFDASGAKVGAPITFSTSGGLSDLITDGNDLLATMYLSGNSNTARYGVVRITATGTVSAPVAIGAGKSYSTWQLAKLGSELIVAWSRDQALQLARATP
jgi:hypothetical protein